MFLIPALKFCGKFRSLFIFGEVYFELGGVWLIFLLDVYKLDNILLLLLLNNAKVEVINGLFLCASNFTLEPFLYRFPY